MEVPVEVERKGKPRRWGRHSEQAWRAMISGQGRSGLSIEAFCAREGVSRSSFRRWRSLISGRASGAAKEHDVERQWSAEAPREGFVDAGVLRVGAATETLELRLEMGGGIVVTIRRG